MGVDGVDHHGWGQLDVYGPGTDGGGVGVGEGCVLNR